VYNLIMAIIWAETCCCSLYHTSLVNKISCVLTTCFYFVLYIGHDGVHTTKKHAGIWQKSDL